MSTLLPPSADVAIIGAGMAGLAAAVELRSSGLTVELLESSDRPGGRVRTDLVDGFRLDRGFQLLNPAYPQLQRLDRSGILDLERLQLQPFDAGVRIALDGRHAVLADPRRSPADLVAAVRAPVGSPIAKARFAAWALRCATARPSTLIAAPDGPYSEALDRAGVRGPLRTGVLDPFLAGVLGEDAGASSARFVSLLIRAFVRGTPAVPAWGMQALPDQLAAALDPARVHLGVRVDEISGNEVRTPTGSLTARAVLVATDPRTAADLTGARVPELNSLTTFWFAADEPPCTRAILHVDGLRRGPVVNAAVMSAAAPAYSPDGRALIAASTVGLADGAAAETAARAHTGTIFGVDPSSWELLRADRIRDALPAMRPPLEIRRPVRLSDTMWVAGDHRDTASLQGALASGTRAARSIAAHLGVS